MKRPIALFEAYGIELEYMIVDQNSLSVRPISDKLLEKAAGEITGDFENGRITWSNELVLHVIELKTTGPDRDLATLAEAFQSNVKRINSLLKDESARLMPTGMHPFMNPARDKYLWPHDNNEVYAAYDRIFDCKGHGWSNLQSTHINLPFANDDEFRRLHTAIRFLLPILPSLTASSPIVEGKLTGYADSRLHYYQQNQKRIPSITGTVIPEPVESISQYKDTILKKIYSDIAPFDPDSILRDDWLNSRGAIARFGRQTIEIRILDSQECPAADIAIAELIISILKLLATGDLVPYERQLVHPTDALKRLFDQTIQFGEETKMCSDYLDSWGMSPQTETARDFWSILWNEKGIASEVSPNSASLLKSIFESGTLASRINRRLGSNPDSQMIQSVYADLSSCLEKGHLFSNSGSAHASQIIHRPHV